MSVSNKMTKGKFDLLIKENLIKSSVSENAFTYRFGEIRKYSEYYSDTEFNRFIDEMEENYPQHYRKFINGAGGELKEKNSRFGMMPPKMASVASSSRFCYLALRDGINITHKNI